MEKKIRLSHTAIEKYNSCSEKYRLHYMEGYRGTTISSALFFGGTWGTAIQDSMVRGLSLEASKEYFDSLFQKLKINDVEYDLPECEHVRYFKGDYDIEYIPNEAIPVIGLDVIENIEEMFKAQSEGVLHVDYQRKLNLAGWHSMRYRAHKLIEAYYEEILPRIVKIHSVEKEINMSTDDGSASLIGFADMICDWRMDDGSVQKVLFDNKTASAKYPKDAIISKPQLTIYEYVENIGTVGYIVGIKKPKKGKFEIQVLTGSIPKEEQEKHIDNIDNTLYNIREGRFEKNPKNCRAFGSQCEFYDICWNNNTGKVVKKDDKK